MAGDRHVHRLRQTDMHHFAIRKAYGSDKLLVEFYPDPSNPDFQNAIRRVLTPLGFSVRTTEHGVWAAHPNPTSPLGAIRSDSDAWCTFGDADAPAAPTKRNEQVMAQFGAVLVASGAFKEVPWHGSSPPGP